MLNHYIQEFSLFLWQFLLKFGISNSETPRYNVKGTTIHALFKKV